MADLKQKAGEGIPSAGAMESLRIGNGAVYRRIRMVFLVGFLSRFLSSASGSFAAPVGGREIIIDAPSLAPPASNDRTMPAAPPPHRPFFVSLPPPFDVDSPPPAPPPSFQAEQVPPAPLLAPVLLPDYSSPSPPPRLSPRHSWNESEKAGIVIASAAALLQVEVVAFLLYKRHQLLSTVEYSDIDDLEAGYPSHRHTESA